MLCGGPGSDWIKESVFSSFSPNLPPHSRSRTPFRNTHNTWPLSLIFSTFSNSKPITTQTSLVLYRKSFIGTLTLSLPSKSVKSYSTSIISNNPLFRCYGSMTISPPAFSFRLHFIASSPATFVWVPHQAGSCLVDIIWFISLIRVRSHKIEEGDLKLREDYKGSLIHSFIQQIFIGCPLFSNLCCRLIL